MADNDTNTRRKLLPTLAVISSAPAKPAPGEGGEKTGRKNTNRLRARPEPGALALSYSEDDAATAAGCGRSTIRRAINAGELVARKLYGRTLILDEDLRAWLRSLPIRKPGRKAAA